MANPSDPKPCRFTPLTPVTIQDRFYRNGHWVTDLSCAYIWWNDKNHINTEMIQEREEVLRSNQAEHVTIRARNKSRPHPDEPGDDLIGAYFALWLPVFALQSRTCKTHFYVSKVGQPPLLSLLHASSCQSFQDQQVHCQHVDRVVGYVQVSSRMPSRVSLRLRRRVFQEIALA